MSPANPLQLNCHSLDKWPLSSSSPFQSHSSLCCLPAAPTTTTTMAIPYKLTFNTVLPFPNQIHSPLPHPSLWQWWMAAFTRLSPLHISLPIRLTTHIHTHWLSIPLSFHLPQTPTLPSLLSHSSSALCTGFHFPPILHPYTSTILCTLLPFSSLFVSPSRCISRR